MKNTLSLTKFSSCLLIIIFMIRSFTIMSSRPSTLFIATLTDTASINIARNMISMYRWTELKDDGEKKVLRTIAREKNIYLWVVNHSLLSLDYANKIFESELESLETEDFISDVFFVSKHAAASGTVSLTVHPIGIPHLLEAGRSGGLPGKCSPPNHHIGALYRNIIKHVSKHKLDKMFQVTLEATHHGPFVEVPTCFVEIGSSETEWCNEDAGKLWAKCIGQYFEMEPSHAAETIESAASSDMPIDSSCDDIVEGCNTYEEMETTKEEGIVCMQIGGGHYVPKMNDMSRFSSRIFAGHALATYTLQDAFESNSVTDSGIPRWRSIIQEAIDSTRIAFPRTKLACYVDKRAFLAEHRNCISTILDENGITWGYSTNDIKKLLKEIDN